VDEFESEGMSVLDDNRGSPERFSSVGMEGPKISVSSTPLRWPCCANARARLTAMVDLPTPPLAEDTAMTLRTSRMLRFSGRPRCRRGSSGGAPERGNPWECWLVDEGVSTLGRYSYQGVLMPQDSRCRKESGSHIIDKILDPVGIGASLGRLACARLLRLLGTEHP
jgi:hypothetical protein